MYIFYLAWSCCDICYAFFPNLFGRRDVVHVCGMFSKVHVTVKVITQIAACLLGLASLLSCGLMLRLAGIHPAFYGIFCCTFLLKSAFWSIGMNFWDDFLGMVACSCSIGEISPTAQSMWLQLLGGWVWSLWLYSTLATCKLKMM